MAIDAFLEHDSQNNRIPLARLEETRREIDHITDGLNLTIDEGIREAVAVLRALTVATTQSCEGHLDRGSPSPYIDISAPGEPGHRFQGEKAQLEELAKKHDIAADEITTWPIEEYRAQRAEAAWQEWQQWTADQSREETTEYETWEQMNIRYLSAVRKLLEEFYSMRPKPPADRLLLDDGRLRIRSALYDQYFAVALAGNQNALASTDRERLRILLPGYQAEMQAFIDFLKNKFFEAAPEA